MVRKARIDKQIIFVGAVALVAVIAVSVLLGTLLTGGWSASVRPFVTPAWPNGLSDTRYTLLLRAERDGGDALLLRYVDRLRWSEGKPDVGAQQVVYRYTQGASSLEPRSIADWDSATGEIRGGLRGSVMTRGTPLVVDNFALQKGGPQGTIVPTAGKTVLSTVVSPSGTYCAVLSATGEQRRISYLVPMSGTSYVTGERYHEVLAYPAGTRIGEAVRLEGAGPADRIRGQWTADGRYVVYYDVGFEHLWIVGVL